MGVRGKQDDEPNLDGAQMIAVVPIVMLVLVIPTLVYFWKRGEERRQVAQELLESQLKALQAALAAKDIDAVQAILITGADILPPKALASAKDWLSAQAVYLG